MMKLKHLADDRKLTMAILQRWDYDEEHLNLLDRFRISANAVYPFRSGGRLRFLRFAPGEEKYPGQIASELDFINHLRSRGYPANKPVPSRAGREIECVDTAKGRYFAVAFEGLPGHGLDPESMTTAQFAGWGRALGLLHRLSLEYAPPAGGPRRRDWRAELDWAEAVLAGFPGEEAALDEVALIRRELSSLPQSPGHYGLIHYDFETDNVFFDPATGAFGVIDFDDAVYHWFPMDIRQALDSAGDITLEQREAFLAGYQAELPLDGALLARAELFGRYSRVWGYARILRCMAGGPADGNPEPDWMVELRGKLRRIAAARAADFGRPL